MHPGGHEWRSSRGLAQLLPEPPHPVQSVKVHEDFESGLVACAIVDFIWNNRAYFSRGCEQTCMCVLAREE